MSRRLEFLIERARRVLEEKREVDIIPSTEMHIFDFDKTLHSDYKPLQCVDIMRQHQDAGIPCYIVTAREKGQEKHIKDTCKRWGIKINQKDIFAIGEDNPKGPVVRKLIDLHKPKSCTFWDDKEDNCENVYENCFDACDELKIYLLSVAVPGDIRKEITSDVNNVRIETKPTLAERKIFRNWRRLSGI